MSREYVLDNKGLLAVIIGFIAVASLGIVGVSVVYTMGNDNFDEGFDQGFDEGFDQGIEDTTPEEYPFNPVLDGEMNVEEGWQTNESDSYLWAEYLIVDIDHMTATNYFYIHIKSGMIYILVDLVSDITDETELLEANPMFPESAGEGDEFISVWIDGDNSKNFFNDESWALTPQETDSHDCFYYDIIDGFLDTAYVPYYSGYDEYLTTLNETDVDIAYGFGSSLNAEIEHRIWEIEINISSLGYFNSSAFNVGFMGYGTMMLYEFTGFWSSPTDLGLNNWYMEFMDEFMYFRCRTINGTDLFHNPSGNADSYYLPIV